MYMECRIHVRVHLYIRDRPIHFPVYLLLQLLHRSCGAITVRPCDPSEEQGRDSQNTQQSYCCFRVHELDTFFCSLCHCLGEQEEGGNVPFLSTHPCLVLAQPIIFCMYSKGWGSKHLSKAPCGCTLWVCSSAHIAVWGVQGPKEVIESEMNLTPLPNRQLEGLPISFNGKQ